MAENEALLSMKHLYQNTQSAFDVSALLIINNPNNEVTLGFADKKQNVSEIKQFEVKENIQMTLQHNISIDNTHSFDHNIHSLREYDIIKLRSIALRYIIIFLSVVVIILNFQALKHKLVNHSTLISQLRLTYLQMNDTQLYQVHWSFLLVYIIFIAIFGLYSGVVMMIDSASILTVLSHVISMSLMYLLLECILYQCHILLIFFNIILLALCHMLIRLKNRLENVLLLHPEYDFHIEIDNSINEA